MTHHSGEERDSGSFYLGNGPSNHDGGALRIDIDDTEAVVDALGVGDKRIEGIRRRLHAEIEKLNQEAPKALVRAQKRKAKEERAAAREERRMAQERSDILRELNGPEKLRLTKTLGVEWDKDGWIFDNKNVSHLLKEWELRRGDDNHVYITTKMPGFKRSWQHFDFDVSTGQWILPFIPDDGVIDADLCGQGWRVKEELLA